MYKLIKDKAGDLCVYWWTNQYNFPMSSFRSDIESCLKDLYLAKEKEEFLLFLESDVKEDKIHHIKSCNEKNCQSEKGLEIALYVINNELKNLQELKVNDNHSSGDLNDINKKIDIIIEELKKTNIGNEILFEELEEIKELSKSLKKKNWSEIVKGKLIDLALSKVIEKETLDFIVKSLIGDNVNLLK